MGDIYNAWLNFSQSYVIMGDNEAACRSLKTASELYPDKWVIWRDLCSLCVFSQKFNMMIDSYNKLLDLKKYYLNVDLLVEMTKHLDLDNVLCRPVDNDLIQKALNLLKRIMHNHPKNSELWAMYGLITISSGTLTEVDVNATVSCLEKSAAYCTGDRNWFRKLRTVQQVLGTCLIITDIFISCCKILKKRNESKFLFKIIINLLKVIISEVYKEHINVITGLIKGEYRLIVEKLEDNLKFLESINI